MSFAFKGPLDFLPVFGCACESVVGSKASFTLFVKLFLTLLTTSSTVVISVPRL